MHLSVLRQKYKEPILNIAKICHVSNVRIFGSVARGEENDASDIDFLVHIEPEAGFSIGGLYWRLEELLGCPVDVVSDNSLHPVIRDKILQEAVPL